MLCNENDHLSKTQKVLGLPLAGRLLCVIIPVLAEEMLPVCDVKLVPRERYQEISEIKLQGSQLTLAGHLAAAEGSPTIHHILVRTRDKGEITF